MSHVCWYVVSLTLAFFRWVCWAAVIWQHLDDYTFSFPAIEK